MTIPTKTAIERWTQALRVLREMTPHERRKHFDMDFWGVKNDCGTIGCLAGHCSLDPWFRRRGFKSEWVKTTLWDEKKADVVPGYELNFSKLEPEEFFGEGAYIFYCGGTHSTVVKEVKRHIKELKEVLRVNQ